MKHWDKTTIKPGSCRLWELGPLCLWVLRTTDEWHVAQIREPGQELRTALHEQTEPLKHLTWQRFAASSETEQIRVQPVMSDLPVIVRPDSPFAIPPATQAVFYVNLPICVRIECLRPHPVELMTIPSIELSLSWFGTPVEGELCYGLRTSAQRSLIDIPNRVHRAICQIKIRNRSDDLLPFQRVCLTVSHLDTYLAGGQLWTTPVSLTYSGEEHEQSIVYGRKPAELAGEAKLLVPAREPPGRRLWQRSLDTFFKLGAE